MSSSFQLEPVSSSVLSLSLEYSVSFLFRQITSLINDVINKYFYIVFNKYVLQKNTLQPLQIY